MKPLKFKTEEINRRRLIAQLALTPEQVFDHFNKINEFVRDMTCGEAKLIKVEEDSPRHIIVQNSDNYQVAFEGAFLFDDLLLKVYEIDKSLTIKKDE